MRKPGSFRELGVVISCESPAVVQLGDDEPLRKPGPYRGLGVVKPVWGLKGDWVAL